LFEQILVNSEILRIQSLAWSRSCASVWIAAAKGRFQAVLHAVVG
jgi:hypothetical protein